MRRSMLFLPGNTPNIIVNGEILGADAVILDLEDAVAPGEKDSARVLVRNAIGRMGFGRCEVIVRINSTGYRLSGRRIWTPLCRCRPDLIMPAENRLRRRTCGAVDAYMTEAREQHGIGLPQGVHRPDPADRDGARR